MPVAGAARHSALASAIGGIIIYDVSIPVAPAFQQYINDRNPAADWFVAQRNSQKPRTAEWNAIWSPKACCSKEAPLLVVSDELNDRTTVYRVDPVGQ